MATEIKSVTKAVIPAAGLGTRFLPATKATPKEMLPVVDRPAIQYVVEEAIRAGLNDVLMITGRNKRALEDHFDRVPVLEQQLAEQGKDALLASVVATNEMGGDLHYVRQGDPKGLGHAVLRAKRHVGDEAFAVLLGDDLIDEKEDLLARMVEVQERTGGSVVALMEVLARLFPLTVQLLLRLLKAKTVSLRLPVWLRSLRLMRLPRTTL